MKLAFSFLLTGLLVGACSDRDPASSNNPAGPSGKPLSSSLIFSEPVAGLAESRAESPGFEVRVTGLLRLIVSSREYQFA